MARLNHEQILEEVNQKGYILIDDSGYTSLNSPIKIQCPHKHIIETNLNTFRRPSFTCPQCDNHTDFINPTQIPNKGDKYRIIALDQATEKFGLSIFDDGKLVYCHLFHFSGDLNTRLMKIQNFIEETVIKCWDPNFIQMEDIQYQNGILTYKVLAMLLGVVQTCCRKYNIQFDAVAPNVWRKYSGTNGQNRKEEKLLSVAMVKEKYNLDVNDDVAESILIGRYSTRMHKKYIPSAFGN